METFVFLTQAAVAALSEDERAAYETALAAFVTAFKAANPTGEAVIKVQLTKLNAMATISNGKPRVAFNVSITDKTIASGIAGKDGLILRPLANADIMAKNNGFFTFGHMALVLMSLMNKGELAITYKLNVKGEAWSAKSGETGIYKSTHLAIVDMVYVPSTAASQAIGQATQKAAANGYERMLFSGFDASVTATPVAVPTETSNDSDDLNP